MHSSRAHIIRLFGWYGLKRMGVFARAVKSNQTRIKLDEVRIFQQHARLIFRCEFACDRASVWRHPARSLGIFGQRATPQRILSLFARTLFGQPGDNVCRANGNIFMLRVVCVVWVYMVWGWLLDDRTKVSTTYSITLCFVVWQLFLMLCML